MDIEQWVETRRGEVRTALGEFMGERLHRYLEGVLPENYVKGVSQMLTYAASGGKTLRGLMAILVCESLGGDPKKAMTAACTSELAHSMSLIGDDVADQDTLRRSRPSFWKWAGLDMAILIPHLGVPHAIRVTEEYGLPAVRDVLYAWLDTASGQFMDTPLKTAKRWLTRGGVDGRDYLEIIERKTAPMFGVSAKLGARAAGKDWYGKTAEGYGKAVGVAFQVYDDYVDLRESMGLKWEEMGNGKPPASLTALRDLLGSGERVSEEDAAKALEIGKGQQAPAIEIARTLPTTEEGAKLLAEFPGFACEEMVRESKP